MKNICLLLLVLITICFSKLNSQTNCSSAIPVIGINFNDANSGYVATEKWYKINGPIVAFHGQLTNHSTGTAKMNKLEVFSGTCVNPVFIGSDEMQGAMDSIAELNYHSGNVSGDIFIRVSATVYQPNSLFDFDVAVVGDTGLMIEGLGPNGNTQCSNDPNPLHNQMCDTLTVCPGDSIYFHGWPNLTHYIGEPISWTFTGGNPSSAPGVCDYSFGQYVTYDSSGIFTVFYTLDLNGQTSNTITVLVYDVPELSFTGPDTVCSGQQACFFVHNNTNVNLLPEFTWTFGDGNGCSNLIPPSGCMDSTACHTYTDTSGIFYPAVTVTTKHGCRYTDSTEVFVMACCVIDSIPHYQDTTLTAAGNFFNTAFQISGTVTVTGNVSWNDCKVFMGPHAKIILGPNTKLTLSRVHILAACDFMWDYIEVPQGDTLDITQRPSLIEDGISAIWVTNGGVLRTNSLIFNKNFTAINFGQTGNANPATSIRRTSFTCVDLSALTTGNFAANYLGTVFSNYTTNTYSFAKETMFLPHLNERSFTGITINKNTNVNPLTIGVSGPNTLNNLFDRIKYGIYSKQSNIRIVNNRFQSINNSGFFTCTDPVDPTPCIECEIGTGICVTGSKTPIVKATIGELLGPNQYSNKFDSMLFSIAVVNPTHLEVLKNDFSNSTYGIFTNKIFSRNVKISENRLQKCYSNIGMSENTGSFIEIENNNVNTVGVLPNPGQIFLPVVGIVVGDVIPSSAQLYIRNNWIRSTSIGIWLNNIHYATAQIYDQNRIQWPSNTWPAGFIYRGIGLFGCTNVEVDNNTVSSNTPIVNLAVLNTKLRGISIENSPNTTVSHNTFKQLGNGVHGYGISTASRLGCNVMYKNFNDFLFTGPFLSANNPLNFSCDIGDQLDNLGNPAPTGNTFNNYNGSSSDLGGNIKPTIAWYYIGYVPTATALQNGSLQNNAVQLSTFPSACTFLPNLRIAQEARKEVAEKPLNNLPLFNSTIENVYHYKQRVYQALKSNQNWLNLNTPDDAMLQAFYNDLQNKNIGKFADVDAEIEQWNFSTADLKNNSIVDSGLAEQNLKIVNSIYISKNASGDYMLTPQEKNTLYNIATQIPLNGGFEAVYRARAMLPLLWEDDQTQSNGLKINLNEIQVTEEKLGDLISLYPNPANEILFIEKSYETNGTVTMYDLTGRIVKTISLNTTDTKLSVDVNELSKGMYLYELNVDGEIKQAGKFSILK
jgi:hypothetical protein